MVIFTVYPYCYCTRGKINICFRSDGKIYFLIIKCFYYSFAHYTCLYIQCKLSEIYASRNFTLSCATLIFKIKRNSFLNLMMSF